MNVEELDRALRHCHAALGETLLVISDLLNQQGDPENTIQRIEQAQIKYNAITRLLKEGEA